MGFFLCLIVHEGWTWRGLERLQSERHLYPAQYNLAVKERDDVRFDDGRPFVTEHDGCDDGVATVIGCD